MKYYWKIFLFLIINFGCLALGSFLMNNGPASAWYLNLNKAPWTPPGRVFGLAWSVIMFCFSFYMAKLISLKNQSEVYLLYGLQCILNVIWNYLFFNLHVVNLAMLILSSLTVLIVLFYVKYKSLLKQNSLLIAPYAIWLLLACSLNGYIILFN
ncbi:TspO/MBR family protein [Formosa sp. S-31]|uniref:TspO/MBR family protein n=1 Tax=Formosa sp. S-31 TaxID=2790949 RepID=UPI003EC05BEB